MEWDNIGWFESVVLFVAVLLIALVNSAGNGILDNFSAITCLAFLTAIGIASYRSYQYQKHGVNLAIGIIFTIISEVAFTTYFLLCLRDIAVVAATGGFLNLIGVILSLPVALLTLSLQIP